MMDIVAAATPNYDKWYTNAKIAPIAGADNENEYVHPHRHREH